MDTGGENGSAYTYMFGYGLFEQYIAQIYATAHTDTPKWSLKLKSQRTSAVNDEKFLIIDQVLINIPKSRKPFVFYWRFENDWEVTWSREGLKCYQRAWMATRK